MIPQANNQHLYGWAVPPMYKNTNPFIFKLLVGGVLSLSRTVQGTIIFYGKF